MRIRMQSNTEKLGYRKLVVVDYQSIVNVSDESKNLRDEIARAFGSDGIGIIGIRNIPGFVEAKNDLLSLTHSLANLPGAELKELEVPEMLFNTGWSHGKEKLKNDTPDLNKASFYFNPLIDVPGTPEERAKFPLAYPYNRWPKADSLPTFKRTAKRLGCLMTNVVADLTRHIDDYAHSINNEYPPNTLHDAMVNTKKVKGRLLYYYPLSDREQAESMNQTEYEDSWIGWHNDSGFLTALSGGLFMEPDGTILPNCPCDDAGLYVVDRKDQVLQVKLPSDCMGVQIGECTQIITGGAVIATPHCVKGAPNVARTSLACFVDTPPNYLLRAPPGQCSSEHLAFSSSRVPPLSKRWRAGIPFGEFLETTFKMYYDYNQLSNAEQESNNVK